MSDNGPQHSEKLDNSQRETRNIKIISNSKKVVSPELQMYINDKNLQITYPTNTDADINFD